MSIYPIPSFYTTWEAYAEALISVLDAEEELPVLQLPSYTVAQVPSAQTKSMLIYVLDEVGGEVPAFSDGTNWRRVTDRAIVS